MENPILCFISDYATVITRVSIGVRWAPALVLTWGKYTSLSEPVFAVALVLTPLAERLNFVHCERREQVIDRGVRRRH